MAVTASTEALPVAVAAATPTASQAANQPQLGFILAELSAKMDLTIQEAIAAKETNAKSKLIEAAAQAKVTIENMRSAFADSLEKTTAQVGNGVDKILEQLTTLVHGIVNKEPIVLDEIAARSLDIAKAFPHTTSRPQLRMITPDYLAMTRSAEQVRVVFDGNFPWSATKGFEPTLTLGDHTCQSLGNTMSRFEFLLPANELRTSYIHSFNYVLGTLDIPWKDKGWLSSAKMISHFKVWLGLLPASPGKIMVNYVSTRSTTNEEKKQSTQFHARSKTAAEVKFTIPAREGWKIGPNPQLVVDKEASSNYTQTIYVDGSQIVVTINLFGKKNVGDVTFHISYTEQQIVQTQITRQEPLEICWGDGKTIKASNPDESIDSLSLEAFDGTRKDFPNTTSLDHPYLQLISKDGVLLVIATLPKANVAVPVAQAAAAKAEKSPEEEQNELLQELARLQREMHDLHIQREAAKLAYESKADALIGRVVTPVQLPSQ